MGYLPLLSADIMPQTGKKSYQLFVNSSMFICQQLVECLYNRWLGCIVLAIGVSFGYHMKQGGGTMELLIKQRVFSWTDSYDVYDASGNARYYVKADFFSIGHRIRIFDKATSEELGCISQRLLALMPTFDIEIAGRTVGTVRKKFSIFGENYEVDYRGWDVEGDFMGWDYQVLQDNREILSISKQWLSWGDTYILRFVSPADELPGLLLVLAIDAANCSHND